MKSVLKFILKLVAILCSLIAVTFTLYWFNLDMKLVRFVYDKLQPHYDNMEKDKKL